MGKVTTLKKTKKKENEVFEYKITHIKTNILIPYINNSRTHSTEQVKQIAASIKEFGFTNPVLIDDKNMIIAGHGRLQAAEKLNMDKVPCIILHGLTDAQKKAYVIADNKLALNAGWDEAMLANEIANLQELDYNIDLLGFSADEINEIVQAHAEPITGLTDEDDCPDIPESPVTIEGDIWTLGNHRLMCGDSTDGGSVALLMDGHKAVLGFNDPPYGMKKENEGVKNDNLNYDDLLEFNKKWIKIQFDFLVDNGSFYCWGIDEPLMDIYSHILKPMIKEQKATFRNLLTWNKSYLKNGNIFNPFGASGSEYLRSFPIADEKCLFVMCGVQGFNNNSDNYFEGWEPIRDYLLQSRLAMGWDVPTMKRIVGHSDLSRDHWTNKSQFNFPTRKVYDAMKAEADRLRGETKNDAFKKEYDELKKEYDELKKDYYGTRAYFKNDFEVNNVLNFEICKGKEKEQAGGHATPKPIDLCSALICASSDKENIILDLFGGSGSTMIAAEKNNRHSRLMELDPKYCDVIIKRWQDYTGKDAILTQNGKTFKEVADERG